MIEFKYIIHIPLLSLYDRGICNFLENLEIGKDYIINSVLKSTGIKYMNYYDTCVYFKNEEDLLAFKLETGI